jgi:hypothetical protein
LQALCRHRMREITRHRPAIRGVGARIHEQAVDKLRRVSGGLWRARPNFPRPRRRADDTARN